MVKREHARLAQLDVSVACTTVRRRQAMPQRRCNHDPRAALAARRLLGGDPLAMLWRPEERRRNARPPSLRPRPGLLCNQSVLGQVCFLSHEKICVARFCEPFLGAAHSVWN